MKRPNRLPYGCLLWAVCLLLTAACSDSGTIPELEPAEPPLAPMPDEETPAEPYLVIMPELLRFDVAGNALDAEALTIRTNCTWRVEQSDAAPWIRMSAQTGTGDASVWFQLYIDESYHETEWQITATDSDGETLLTRSFRLQQGTKPAADDSRPSDSEQPDDSEHPDNPESPDNPEQPAGPDGPGTPDHPDTPDTPGQPDEPGESETPDTPDNPDTPETPDQPEPPAPPVDNPPATEEPDAKGGGSDDFAALPADSRFMRQVGPTPAGWQAENCAVYAGGAYDSDPVYGSLLGSDRTVRGLSLNGNRRAPGRIVSPELTGGCGRLTFHYGITQTGDERVDLTVAIEQEETTVRTFRLQTTAAKLQCYTYACEVHVAGTFRITITNNCPSGAEQEQERCTLFGIVWTGEPAR